MIWYMIWYDIFVNCNWVYTRWQWYSTHLHKQYIEKYNENRICMNLEVKIEASFQKYPNFIENETFGGNVCTLLLLHASHVNLTW